MFEVSGFGAELLVLCWFLALLIVLDGFKDPKQKIVWKSCPRHPHQDTCIHRQEKKP